MTYAFLFLVAFTFSCSASLTDVTCKCYCCTGTVLFCEDQQRTGKDYRGTLNLTTCDGCSVNGCHDAFPLYCPQKTETNKRNEEQLVSTGMATCQSQLNGNGIAVIV